MIVPWWMIDFHLPSHAKFKGGKSHEGTISSEAGGRTVRAAGGPVASAAPAGPPDQNVVLDNMNLKSEYLHWLDETTTPASD
jgi:hypothetical protein